MMPRKKRITILVISIVLTILIILGILGYLYLKTDMFKTKEPVEEKKEELIVIQKENFLKRIINRIKKFFI